MKTTTILRNLLAVLAVLGVTPAADAAGLFTETFAYPNGSLHSVSGGLWTKMGIGRPLNVSDGKVTLHQVAGYDCSTCGPLAFLSEDAYRGFSALTAGQTLYAGLDVSASGGLGTYGVSETSLNFARGVTNLFVTAFTGSDFTFGIGNSIYTPAVSWPNGLAFDATYRVVLSYEFDSGISKLWVNPTGESSTYVSFTDTASQPRSAFSLWQGRTYYGEPSAAQVLDNLVLGTTFDDVRAVPGDFNRDTVVDGADLAQWEGDFGGNDHSDADRDGDSDGADFLIWQRQLGSPALAVAANAPVPEPVTFLLFIVATAGIHRMRPNASRTR